MNLILIQSLIFIALLTACGGDLPSPTNKRFPLDTLPMYEVIGSGPIVVVLAVDKQSTLNNPATTNTIVPRLLTAGYSVLSLDLPCHGADTETGVHPLECWARRINSGDNDIFLRFCAGLSGVLDKLNAPTFAMVGISRGAYVAITCAAYDTRLRNLALEIPVTNLNYLNEFKLQPVQERLFGTDQFVPYIIDRVSLVRIGRDDTRVGTDLAVSFSQKINATLELTNAIGHDVAENGSTITWMQSHPF